MLLLLLLLVLARCSVVAVTELVTAAALGRVWAAAAGAGEAVVVTANAAPLTVVIPAGNIAAGSTVYILSVLLISS